MMIPTYNEGQCIGLLHWCGLFFIYTSEKNNWLQITPHTENFKSWVKVFEGTKLVTRTQWAKIQRKGKHALISATF